MTIWAGGRSCVAPTGGYGYDMNKRSMLVLAVIGIFAAVLLLFRLPHAGRVNLNTAERQLVRDATARQANHEHGSVAQIQSNNEIEVTKSPSGTCVNLRNINADVSSIYCYRHAGQRWTLTRERVGTK